MAKPFRFLVGPSAREYFIHRTLVARLSPPLNALVNGGMRESREGCVAWDDVEEDVFQRFAQFAYTGLYTDYEPTDLVPGSDTSPSADQAVQITAKVVEKLLGHMSPKTSEPRPPVPGAPSVTSENATVLLDEDPTRTVRCCIDISEIAAWDAKAANPLASRQEPAGNEKKDAFRLPYSLASYERAATDWLAGRSNHSRTCKQRVMRAVKRKFESLSCDCDLGSDGTPSEKKRDFISAFMAKVNVLPVQRRLHWQWAAIAAQTARTDRAAPTTTTTTTTTTAKSTKMAKTATASAASSLDLYFEPVFVGHARMWVFADRYQIASLMDLACAKLVHGLADWTMSAATFVPQFGGLVRYVYDERTMVGCQLRLLVAQFAACVVEDVEALDEWPALVNEVPDFAVDLMRQMTNRFG